ncbi:MAG: hypothetical protein ACJ764_02090 [Solirubrobacteraceae bacterium]
MEGQGGRMGDVDGPPTREYILASLRDLVGRRIEDVRLVSDDEEARLVEDPEAEGGVRLVRRGEPDFETHEIKLCLDDGKEFCVGLTDFSISGPAITRGPYSSLEEMLADEHATPETKQQIRKLFGPRPAESEGTWPDNPPDAEQGGSTTSPPPGA